MPKRRRTRVYWRSGRAWGDFRDFADVGGAREPLVPEGAGVATQDADIAAQVATDRLKELEERRRSKILTGVERETTLKEFAAHHLVELARAGRVARWLEQLEAYLRDAVDFFGDDRGLRTVRVRDVQRWAAGLARRSNGRGGVLSAGTIRHHLNALSGLYNRAQSEEYVPAGYNPVAAMLDKPVGRPLEAAWLEVADAALLLESARTYRPPADRLSTKGRPTLDQSFPFMYPLLATFLLTGGRKAEVLGLEVDDVSFDRRTITFRPNQWRRLKTRTSHRSVPLWPQLEEVLRGYVFGGDAPLAGGLLFPSAVTGGMVVDLDKQLDSIAEKAGWKRGEVRSKAFRHTYCAARLQTLDRGAPVGVYTVGRELGHGGDALVKRVYGHLGEVRHRSDVVEYRTDQHVRRLEAEVEAAESDRGRRAAEVDRIRAALDGYRGRLAALRA